MTYELVFDDEALKEWKKLQPKIKELFKTQLREDMQNPKSTKRQILYCESLPLTAWAT
ncbi:type II toxin-antitoxin system RelE family toxin [Cellvibrio mixtus]|uniref:type II toxin-antitoxin system RelE family toxin n=1 Tax=Cellvibrio mixtus TaxID=39650 RepID=UPI000ADD725E|nr:hypothetical protein [Cellvibrio mixtus]